MQNYLMKLILLLLLILPFSASAQESVRLTGTPIQSAHSWSRGGQTALDDDLTDNGAKCNSASLGWFGLDLGEGGESVVTRVEWYAKDGGSFSTLAVFEGANDPDFLEAFPLYMTPVNGSTSDWNAAEVHVNRPFRYLRYVGPHNSYCRLRGLRFYGYPCTEAPAEKLYYQPTNLPLVVISTVGSQEPVDKYNDVTCHIAIFHEEGTKRTDCSGNYRYRGNGTLTLEKKPYRIKFDEKRKAPGAPGKAKKWTLLPQHGDKSLLRTLLAFDVSRRMEMPYTSYIQPVDVIINGEYRGCYDLCDQLEVRDTRINLDEMTAEDVSGEALTGGYFFEMDCNKGYGDVGFKSAHNNPFTIKSPDEDVIQTAQINYLKSHYNTFENAVYQKKYETYSPMLDIETFCRFFLINELATNTDAYWETYMYKHRGDDRICFGPVWDFDLGFDNDQRTHSYMTYQNNWLYAVRVGSYGSSCAGDLGTSGSMRTFITDLVSDSHTSQRLSEVWAHYRAKGVLNTDSLQACVDIYSEELDESQKLNFTRWPVLNSRIMQNYTARGSYEAEVAYVRQFVGTRMNWIDAKLSVEATSLELTLPEEGWATLYLPTAFSAPEGVEIFAVNGLDAETSTLRLDTVFTTEANRPYLIHATVPGTYTIETEAARSFSVKAINANPLGLLTGTHYSHTIPAGSYLLESHGGQLAFVRQKSPTTLLAHQAYLTLPADEPVTSNFLWIEGASGLDELTSLSRAPLAVYSLSGHLLLQYAHAADYSPADLLHRLGPGLYMVGGKKVDIR